VVLSEVNPTASYKPVTEQAVEWLQLVDRGDALAFSALPYRDQISRLRDLAEQRGKQLVVRDWVTVNFLPHCAGDRAEPSGQLEQEMYLARAGLVPLSLVVTRRAAAVYRSLRHNFPHLKELSPETFASAYASYARAVAHLPRVHLEALRADPEVILKQILGHFGFDASDSSAILGNFHLFRSCTGNTALRESSESASSKVIIPAVREPSIVDIPNVVHSVLAEADRVLGYGT
jgi:hypothetical protein